MNPKPSSEAHLQLPPIIQTLDRGECEAILARNHIGRVAYALHDRVDIAPLHYVLLDGWLYGRTSHGGKLSIIAHNHWVAFEVDEVAGLLDCVASSCAAAGTRSSPRRLRSRGPGIAGSRRSVNSCRAWAQIRRGTMACVYDLPPGQPAQSGAPPDSCQGLPDRRGAADGHSEMPARYLVPLVAVLLSACAPAPSPSPPVSGLARVACKNSAETLYVNTARVEYVVSDDGSSHLVFGVGDSQDLDCPAATVAAQLRSTPR